jgi:hypothetical protein
MTKDLGVGENVDIVLANRLKGARHRGAAAINPIDAATIATKVTIRMGRVVTAAAVEEILRGYAQQGTVQLAQRADGSLAVIQINEEALSGDHLQRQGSRRVGRRGKPGAGSTGRGQP